MSSPRIPLNFFGMAFGLAGLGEVWTIEAGYHHAPPLVGDLIFVLSAVVWAVVLGAYLRHVVDDRAVVARDLLDPVAAPFASLALITPTLLAGLGLFPHAETAGRVVTDAFVVLTVLLGGWFTGQWIHGGLDLDTFHPGYFLPTVAGGLVGSASAAAVGQERLAELMFGLGLVCWLVLGSIVLARLMFRPMLPVALQPTLAIEVAPAAVASLAWFQIGGERIGVVAALLAGYGMLMVLAQLRLLPAYGRLPFMPSTWAFTFSGAAVASVGVVWLELTHVAGYRAWQYVVLAVVTAGIAAIAVRTVVAISRHELLPRPPAPAAPQVALWSGAVVGARRPGRG